MDNREEKINALLLDNRFVDWVINPQSPYAEYWLQWINTSRENALLAEEAKNSLLEFRATEIEVDKEINERVAEQMLAYIREAIDQDLSPVLIKKTTNRRWYWMAAAAVITGIIIVFFGTGFFKLSGEERSVAELNKKIQPSAELTRFNGSEKNELVFLPDGSKVTLAKGSRISYNRLMNGKKRKVCLTGEAFFDVTKSPERPFYIHTENMIIKVLGTSFRVTASAGKESVAVKTGKVSVYLKGRTWNNLPQKFCCRNRFVHIRFLKKNW